VVNVGHIWRQTQTNNRARLVGEDPDLGRIKLHMILYKSLLYSTMFSLSSMQTYIIRDGLEECIFIIWLWSRSGHFTHEETDLPLQ